MKIETLCVNPFVAVIDDVFDAELANRIITIGKPLMRRARVIDQEAREFSTICAQLSW